ncbi:MAG: aspartyl protease [Tepidiformaceae bacterium]
MTANRGQAAVGITYLEGRLRGPGIERKPDITLVLADGSSIERAVGECHITLSEGDGTSPVILGEPGDVALLGVVTLEVVGLVFNPLSRTLHPMRMLLV